MDKRINYNQFRKLMLSKINMFPAIKKAKACYIFDEQGNQYLDCLAQFGAVPLGHNADVVNGAICDYLKSQHPSFIQPFAPASSAELSELLCKIAGKPYNHVVYTNSGAETVEAALKLARMKTGRKKVLSTVNSFHGKTFSALSATGSEKYSHPLTVDTALFDKVAFNDIGALSTALETGDYAAFIVEPIQGEGGMVVAEKMFLQAAEQLCKTHGTLFILDEIQTGLGRTGHLLAKDNYQLTPDVILLSKALGGGAYPIGAAIVRRAAYCKEFDKKHSSTFASGGLGAHVALTTLKTLLSDASILDNVRCSATYIQRELHQLATRYPDIFSFQGDGLMYALRFHDPNAHIVKNIITSHIHNADCFSYLICGFLFNARNILCMPFLGDAHGSIRFEPSLIIQKEQLAYFVNAIHDVCMAIRHQRYDVLMSYLIGRDFDDHDIITPYEAKPLCNPVASSKATRKYAFLIHCTSAQDTIKVLPPAVRDTFTHDELLKMSDWLIDFSSFDPSPVCTVAVTMKSKTDVVAEGVLVASPIGAREMMKLPAAEKKALIENYVAEAKAFGAEVIGLGAYTSVITRAGTEIADSDVHFTTGNSFTAMSTAEAIKEKAGDAIVEKSLSIIGARGTVGRLAFLELVQSFNRVNLVGNPKSGTDSLKETIVQCMSELIEEGYQGKVGSALANFESILLCMNDDIVQGLNQLQTHGIDYLDKMQAAAEDYGFIYPFFTTSDVTAIADKSHYVFSATSEGKPFISANIFSSGTIIYDVARPFDFVEDDACHVEIIEGGLVNQPEAVMFSDSNIAGKPAGINLACLSETVALAMENIERSYSIGQSIAYSEAREVYDICVKQGFSHYSPNQTEGTVDRGVVSASAAS